MSDERVVLCEACGGDGGFEIIHNDEYPGSYNGDPRRSWSPCVECDGTGEIIIVASLVEHDDLDAAGFTGYDPTTQPYDEP